MRLRVGCVTVLLSFAIAADGYGQSYGVVHAFKEGPRYPQGSLLRASDGRFYSTTSQGGDSDLGTVFVAEHAASGVLTIARLHSFSGPDGAKPMAGLVEAGGFLYGTTTAGGVYGFGTIFRMSLSGALTTIHSFDGDDGALPAELLHARDGDLYGVTRAIKGSGVDGLRHTGTVFKITATGSFTQLHSFAISGLGAGPAGALLQAADGTLYGTTLDGGSHGGGTISGCRRQAQSPSSTRSRRANSRSIRQAGRRTRR